MEEPLPSIIVRIILAHPTLVILASLLFLEHVRHVPAIESLECTPLQIQIVFCSLSTKSVLICCHLGEDSDNLDKITPADLRSPCVLSLLYFPP